MTTLLLPLLLLACGLAVLTAGAECLVRGASRIALRFGVNPLVVGLTIVAFGTSAPELAVSANAAIQGNSEIAVGNIVGSNIFNVAVILGLASLISPLSVHVQIIRREMPLMLVASLVFVLFVATGGITRWEGMLLFAGVIAYTCFAIMLARRENAATAEPDATSPAKPPPSHPLAVSALLVILGLGLLVGGAKLMVDNAVVIATHMGISRAVVGLTIVAAGTSLPELATSVIAALRRETDIAVGNIVGSNIFNVLCIGGASGLLAPPVTASGVTWLDFGCMLATSLLLLPLMSTHFSIKRWEGALLMAAYGIYLALIWPKTGSIS